MYASVKGKLRFFFLTITALLGRSQFKRQVLLVRIYEVSGKGEITCGCVTFIVSVHIYYNCYSNLQCFRLDNNYLIS